MQMLTMPLMSAVAIVVFSAEALLIRPFEEAARRLTVPLFNMPNQLEQFLMDVNVGLALPEILQQLIVRRIIYLPVLLIQLQPPLSPLQPLDPP